MAPRFVKQQRDRNSSTSSNTWDKSTADMSHIGDVNESDFGQRATQAIDKVGHDVGIKSDAATKLSATMIFENTNFKSIGGPIKRQAVPTNQQQGPHGAQQRTNQYEQVQSNNLGGHHAHHSQPPHHLDKKADDVFKTANSGANFQDMLDTQQMQQQVQRSHQSQADSISSALHNMSFQKSDAEYEKDLKLAFTFESEMPLLTEDKTNKGLCIPPSRSSAIHSVATGQNTISPSIADLSKKITSVKKVWESAAMPMPTVIEHSNATGGSGNNDDGHLSSTFAATQNQQHNMHQFTHAQQQLHQSGLGAYTNTFSADPSALDHFAKAGGPDGDIGADVGYNPNPQQMVGGNNAHSNANMKHNVNDPGNVCKVKPSQQMHQSGLGLSPPPMQQNMQAAPQPPYYQPSQFGGISAIPSPPAVLYNSTPMPSQGNLYGHYERYITSAHYGATGNAGKIHVWFTLAISLHIEKVFSN